MRENGKLKEWLEAFLYAVAIVIVLYFVAWPFKIEGASMENSFFTGDRIVVSRVMAWGNFLKQGDLVICRLSDSQDIIKRVIGQPGDRVDIRAGKVYINGEKLDEPYLKEDFTMGEMSVLLSEREYFVMGDNRAASTDSRELGPLSRSRFVGKTILRWFPFDQIAVY